MKSSYPGKNDSGAFSCHHDDDVVGVVVDDDDDDVGDDDDEKDKSNSRAIKARNADADTGRQILLHAQAREPLLLLLLLLQGYSNRVIIIIFAIFFLFLSFKRIQIIVKR